MVQIHQLAKLDTINRLVNKIQNFISGEKKNIVKTKENLIGKIFGKLTVIEQSEDYIKTNGKHLAMWKCKCECGNYTKVLGYTLKNGNTKSCGCLAKK